MIESISFYLILMIPIVIWVGRACYHHGMHYIRAILQNETWVIPMSRLLLIAYYLLNIGLVVINIRQWPQSSQPLVFFEILYTKVAIQILVIGFMHYFNMAAIKTIQSFMNRNHITN